MGRVIPLGTGGSVAVGGCERGAVMSGKHHKPLRWRRGRGAGHPAPPRQSLTEMVDSAGWAHLVTSEAFEAGLREGVGGYAVLCGRRIAAASMVTQPDRYCRPCQLLGAWT